MTFYKALSLLCRSKGCPGKLIRSHKQYRCKHRKLHNPPTRTPWEAKCFQVHKHDASAADTASPGIFMLQASPPRRVATKHEEESL